ncbi:serine protease [Okeania sp.]|uniref:S1 family peptidase n=1 Tax=Okeania sp. TaxID=3100323 RepID=UPI002B4AB326|nr:serine protease [Okeania sp.]MEB3340953.1 serine protease [Okeania sp.]
MKHLPRILGLTFLALTLTNCSLSSEQIASRLERSIVKLSYRNQGGHGTGFFVRGEKGVCTVLTAAHVVEEKGQILLQTNKNRELKQIDKVEIFPGTIDLAVVTFQVEGNCNYPALKIGNSRNLKKGSSIYISGFPDREGIIVDQFVEGKVSGLNKLREGYGVSYQALTVGGMSGAPVVDVKGEVVAVHGTSDFEIVQNFASLQGSLSESERQIFQFVGKGGN